MTKTQKRVLNHFGRVVAAAVISAVLAFCSGPDVLAAVPAGDQAIVGGIVLPFISTALTALQVRVEGKPVEPAPPADA